MPINSIFSWLIKKRLHQIDLFLKYPHDVQKDQFKHLLHCARYTEWGKKFDYAGINSHAEYARRVPINTYEDLQPYIQRTMNGEQNLLWHTTIDWFAKSSGTTSDRSKYIPVSREALEDCHYKGGKDLLGIYLNHKKKSKIYMGKSLMVGGSAQPTPGMNDNAFTGDLSAIIIKNLPMWVHLRQTPDVETSLLNDWEEKLEKMARTTIKENVTNVSGVPSWTLNLFKRVLDITGAENILEVWPNIELYMHGGVSFKPYREQFERLIPSDQMSYIESYNASEGYFGIAEELGSDELLLMLDYGIYYEFMPMSEFGSENPIVLPLEEVEAGTNYALIISTNGGLWRYMIGDTIMFTSTEPYRFNVTGRTKHFINTFGEELIIENAEAALAKACQETGAVINEYHGGPVFMNDKEAGGHEWLIEFDKEPQSMEAFIEAFDNALKEVNTDYEAKRSNDLTLRKPLIRSLPNGTFYAWLGSRGKLGGQNKVPRLANDRTHLESILKYADGNKTHA